MNLTVHILSIHYYLQFKVLATHRLFCWTKSPRSVCRKAANMAPVSSTRCCFNLSQRSSLVEPTESHAILISSVTGKKTWDQSCIFLWTPIFLWPPTRGRGQCTLKDLDKWSAWIQREFCHNTSSKSLIPYSELMDNHLYSW
jgi:hypothetical protein